VAESGQPVGADVGPFAEYRNLLFRVAYDLLGSVADAEDVVQETWLRWSADDRSQVDNPRAYLVRIATNQALNRLRAAKARRETYVGPWLPEPIVDEVTEGSRDPAEVVAERAAKGEAISLAMLVVLETLSPSERAVFVLREVFGMSHDEIAAALDRSAASVRQMAHRAREHVQARRPRFEAPQDERQRITEQFLAACMTGDIQALLGLLAPDVTVVSDGGGKVRAARRPILGADKVSRFLMGIADEAAKLEMRFALVNGDLGFVAYDGDHLQSVLLLDVVDGQIRTVYSIANPDKLAHLSR
jgi:RNA polymerase sigma-70 factor (ECF subfamily)